MDKHDPDTGHVVGSWCRTVDERLSGLDAKIMGLEELVQELMARREEAPAVARPPAKRRRRGPWKLDDLGLKAGDKLYWCELFPDDSHNWEVMVVADSKVVMLVGPDSLKGMPMQLPRLTTILHDKPTLSMERATPSWNTADGTNLGDIYQKVAGGSVEE